MKINSFNIIVCVITLGFVSCSTRTRQSQATSGSVSISDIEEKNFLEMEQIKSRIEKDVKKRQLGVWRIEQSASSPLFYEAICDDGLYLYRYISHGDDVSVIMLEDDNISYLEDCIGDLTDYEHKGYYEILDDSTVAVIFEEWYRNYCQPDDTTEAAHLYHILCTHSYKLANMKWKSTKKDTIILQDERELFSSDEILEYIYQ